MAVTRLVAIPGFCNVLQFAAHQPQLFLGDGQTAHGLVLAQIGEFVGQLPKRPVEVAGPRVAAGDSIVIWA